MRHRNGQLADAFTQHLWCRIRKVKPHVRAGIALRKQDARPPQTLRARSAVDLTGHREIAPGASCTFRPPASVEVRSNQRTFNRFQAAFNVWLGLMAQRLTSSRLPLAHHQSLSATQMQLSQDHGDHDFLIRNRACILDLRFILLLPDRSSTANRYNPADMKLHMRRCPIGILVVVLATCGQFDAQAGQPDGGGVRTGVLPRAWNVSGPQCAASGQFQIHEYNQDLYILRESGCLNYEKPFLYLLFGKEKALLLDTGAGKTDVARVVKTQIDGWLSRNNRESIPLIVAHTHAHRDHISGDEDLKVLPRTTVVEPKPSAVQAFFGFRNWPNEVASYDLGDRILDVIPIPGHEATSIAIYDRQTGILFTGDSLYPGRLYVEDAPEFTRSIQRLVDFTHGKIVTHVLGNHIEQTRTPYLDYPIRSVYQPDEHQLELGRAHLLELNEALHDMNGKITRMAFRDFTIWPD